MGSWKILRDKKQGYFLAMELAKNTEKVFTDVFE